MKLVDEYKGVIIPRNLDFKEYEYIIFEDFANLPHPPLRAKSLSMKGLKAVADYIRTGSIIEACVNNYSGINRTDPPKKILDRLYDAPAYRTHLHYVLWISARKYQHNLYFKINGEDVIPCEHFKNYFCNIEFKSKELDTKMYGSITQKDDYNINLSNPHLFRREQEIIGTNRDGSSPDRIKKSKVRQISEIPARVLNNPSLVNYDTIRDMTDEEFRLHMLDIHLKNIHLIALDDEEKATDRIKASDIVLKIVGAYQLYNEQKKPESKHIHIHQNTQSMIERLKEIDLEMKNILSSDELETLRDNNVYIQPKKELTSKHEARAAGGNKTFAREKFIRDNEEMNLDINDE
jgi:hypothetical protein